MFPGRRAARNGSPSVPSLRALQAPLSRSEIRIATPLRTPPPSPSAAPRSARPNSERKIQRTQGMRFLASFLCMGLIAGSLQAQSPTIIGPALGFVPDLGGTGIRPILGIPGASLLVDRLQLETEVRNI